MQNGLQWIINNMQKPWSSPLKAKLLCTIIGLQVAHLWCPVYHKRTDKLKYYLIKWTRYHMFFHRHFVHLLASSLSLTWKCTVQRLGDSQVYRARRAQHTTDRGRL